MDYNLKKLEFIRIWYHLITNTDNHSKLFKPKFVRKLKRKLRPIQCATPTNNGPAHGFVLVNCHMSVGPTYDMTQSSVRLNLWIVPVRLPKQTGPASVINARIHHTVLRRLRKRKTISLSEKKEWREACRCGKQHPSPASLDGSLLHRYCHSRLGWDLLSSRGWPAMSLQIPLLSWKSRSSLLYLFDDVIGFLICSVRKVFDVDLILFLHRLFNVRFWIISSLCFPVLFLFLSILPSFPSFFG